MKTKQLLLQAVAACSLLLAVASSFAQGTAFTYQGLLSNGTNLANGSYDMTFKLFNASSGPSQIGGTVTQLALGVTNGLFTTQIDFGALFNGTPYWLEIGVRTNGGGSYTTLAPRQALTPTPYAITAENVDGAVPAGQLTGTIPAGVLTGANGAGLLNLNASDLTAGTVADARLSANVALLNANQTFVETNIFASGGGAGRLIVSNSFTAVDTNLFTGLSLQYDAGFGEGALMSSYNNGTAYLSFYTKLDFSSPVAKQVIIDRYGGVAIDQQNANNGLLDHATAGGAGLTFGTTSGEGIASKRTAGGDQFGLDFYTGFSNRMSILNTGFVGIGRQTQVSGAELFGLYSPVTNTWGGMYIQTGTGGRPFYGYANGSYAWTELDGTDGNKWKLYNSGYWVAVTPGGQMGVGTNNPAAQLHVTKLGGSGATDGYGGGPGIISDVASGDSIYATTTDAGGFGVWANATSGTAVVANATTGSGVSASSGGGGTGVAGSSSTGIGVYASSGSGPALTIGNGVIQVSGAGTNSSTTAFIHYATAANTSSYITTIHNSLCDGNPNAILIATHNFSPVGVGGTYQTHPYSVWYNGSNWTIYNDDFAAITGECFNVLIMRP
jgi:hypothetical protein